MAVRGQQLAADKPQRHHYGLTRHLRQTALQGGAGAVTRYYALTAEASAEASSEDYFRRKLASFGRILTNLHCYRTFSLLPSTHLSPSESPARALKRQRVGLVPERRTRSPHTLMVTVTWTATVTRMARCHTAQRTSPYLPIFECLCYIKKQYGETMAFTPTIRARATSSSAGGGHTWRRCSSGENISRRGGVRGMRTAVFTCARERTWESSKEDSKGNDRETHPARYAG